MVAITGRRRLIAKKFRNGPRQRQLVDVGRSDQASVNVDLDPQQEPCRAKQLFFTTRRVADPANLRDISKLREFLPVLDARLSTPLAGYNKPED